MFGHQTPETKKPRKSLKTTHRLRLLACDYTNGENHPNCNVNQCQSANDSTTMVLTKNKASPWNSHQWGTLSCLSNHFPHK